MRKSQRKPRPVSLSVRVDARHQVDCDYAAMYETRPDDDTASSRNLAVETLEVFTLQGLDETAKRDFGNILKPSLPANGGRKYERLSIVILYGDEHGSSSIGVFGSDENSRNFNDCTIVTFPEDEPVRSYFLPEPSLPLSALQRFYVAPLGFFLQLKFVDRAFNPFPDVAREPGKLLFGLAREFNAPRHSLCRARIWIVHA